MATKSNLIANFRASVQTMQAAYGKALELAHLAELLGWDEAALASEFSSSSDITADDFVAAMQVVKGIETSNAGIAAVLAKMGG
jgi:hypothetical protein